MNVSTPDSHKNSRTVVFTDLDDTLIQTKHKLPEEAHYHLGATDRQGAPLSYFTQSQIHLLTLFQQAGALIIPVTGRNKDALDRVEYDFPSYKVVSHGAVVLNDDGSLCQAWLSAIDTELKAWPEKLEQSNREINSIIQTHDLDARARVIVDQDIPAYVSIKGTSDALETIRTENPLDGHFYRHENGRNHALLPPYTRKKRAVAHIHQQLGLHANDLTIGLGDSMTDLPFMQACQFAMFPSESQIVREGLNTVAEHYHD